MGFLDKIKGLMKGRETQVKGGIDKVSDTVEKKVAGPRRQDRRRLGQGEGCRRQVCREGRRGRTGGARHARHHAGRHRRPPPLRRSRRRPRRRPHRRPDANEGRDLLVTPLRSRRLRSFARQLVLDLVDGVLDLAGRLVDLALALQVLVAGQIADGFLDPTLGLVSFATHGGVLSRRTKEGLPLPAVP